MAVNLDLFEGVQSVGYHDAYGREAGVLPLLFVESK